MLSLLLDIEWLLSTLFDASLLTFEPPETAALFCSFSAMLWAPWGGARSDHHGCTAPVSAANGIERRVCNLRCPIVEYHKALTSPL